MKLSAYYKSQGKAVVLKTDTENLADYEKVFISKVFTKTYVNEEALSAPNVIIGGTGFFYDTEPKLPQEIEHIMPDYSLYDNHVTEQMKNGAKASALKHYTDYSIGFLTRGCFRKCSFCVNRNSDTCVLHSPLDEFYDPSRKKIMLLDDNFLANPNWRELLQQLIELKKTFTFKQGLDIRLVSKEFAVIINSAKYDMDIFFSFDNIADSEIIERKLNLLRQHTKKPVRIYILCGYDYENNYDTDFWRNDIENIFKRLEIIGKYGVTPYLMRHNNYLNSPHAGMYKTLATYCNKMGIFKSCSFEDFCNAIEVRTVRGNSAAMRYFKTFIEQYPEFRAKYCQKLYWNKP